MLVTERLKGEPAAMEHAAVLHERLYSDARVMATLGGGTRTVEQVQAGIARYMAHAREHGFGAWVFSTIEEKHVIGLGGLMYFEIDEGRVPGLVYHVAADSWGRGFATEIAKFLLNFAFGSAGLDAVYSWTLPENRASQRVMEKCGMERFREGTYAGLPHVFYRLKCFPIPSSRG